MFRPSNPPRRPRARRGAILIVVLALLALFAVIGISFVFYADSEANAARIHREGAARGEPAPPDGTFIINHTLAELIFDSDSTNSPLRGHSLLRDMYGWGTGSGNHNTPFNGVGTFHQSLDVSYLMGLPDGSLPLLSRGRVVNYTTIPANHLPLGLNGAGALRFLLDPEQTGFQYVNNAGALVPNPSGGTPVGGTGGPARHYVGRNAPYTYPDLKSFYLASISPATGEILVPSFHRSWLFNAGTPNDPTNPGNPNVGLRLAPWNPTDTAPGSNTAMNKDWVTALGRTRILRPRPIDQLTVYDFPPFAQNPIDPQTGLPPSPPLTYPLPADPTNLAALNIGQQRALWYLIATKIAAGEILPYPSPNGDGSYTADLQNITGSNGTQRNDSILLDFGLTPIQYNGRYVQPLVAITVLDQDGRVQLDSNGNIVSGTQNHSSFAGMGPNEVSIRRVFEPDLTPGRYPNADTDSRNLAGRRYIPTANLASRGGTTNLYLDRSQTQLPAYSAYAWRGQATQYVSVLMPSFTGGTPVGSSRVDLQACKLEYSIVSPK